MGRIQQVIEALGRYQPCDEDGSVCVANRLAVEETRAMLGEYAAEVARLREDADIQHDKAYLLGMRAGYRFEDDEKFYRATEGIQSQIDHAIAARSAP